MPRNLAVQIFRALLENNASFYGAQMSAMDNATRNAGDMIHKQTLIYNRIWLVAAVRPSDVPGSSAGSML